MSNAVSALNGKTATGPVTVQELGLTGMVTLRGDFEDEGFAAAVTQLTGLQIPDVRQFQTDGVKTVLWMSPDELLVVLPYAEVNAFVAGMNDALAGSHYLVANVSDARAIFRVSGDYAGEVLGKNAPVDFEASQFVAGMVRRSRVGQVAAAYWKLDDGSFRVVCFRSVAEYVFGLIATSAKAGPVGVY